MGILEFQSYNKKRDAKLRLFFLYCRDAINRVSMMFLYKILSFIHPYIIHIILYLLLILFAAN